MRKLSIIVGLIFILGCHHAPGDQPSPNQTEYKEIPEEHVQLLSSFDWKIESMKSVKKESINYLPEHEASLKSNGVDLSEYEGAEVKITSYVLEVRQVEGGEIYASIYEVDGEIIGGKGNLADWSPGNFSLDDKERLIEEGIVNE